jgi:hypothetical protein
MANTAAYNRSHTHPTAATEVDTGRRVLVGVVAGVLAGIIFALLSMVYAAVAGPGLWAPPRMIATILGFEMAPTFAVVPVVAGLALHMMISAVYGAAFVFAAGSLRGGALLAAGMVFGLALYVVNFHVFAQLEHFAAFEMMAGNWFEIAVHALFGVLLAGGYAAWRERRSTEAA